MTAPVRWEVPPKVWALLASLVAGVLVLFAVFSVTAWVAQRANDRRDTQLRRDLCEVTGALAVPTPLPTGPAGERARVLVPKMDALRKTSCDGVTPSPS